MLNRSRCWNDGACSSAGAGKRRGGRRPCTPQCDECGTRQRQTDAADESRRKQSASTEGKGPITHIDKTAEPGVPRAGQHVCAAASLCKHPSSKSFGLKSCSPRREKKYLWAGRTSSLICVTVKPSLSLGWTSLRGEQGYRAPVIKATHSRKWGRPSPFPNSFLVRFGCLKERDQRRGREQDREGMVENGRVNSAQRRSLSPSDLKFARFADHFIRAKQVWRQPRASTLGP